MQTKSNAETYDCRLLGYRLSLIVAREHQVRKTGSSFSRFEQCAAGET